MSDELEQRRKAAIERKIAAREFLCGDGCRGCAWCRRSELRGVNIQEELTAMLGVTRRLGDPK